MIPTPPHIPGSYLVVELTNKCSLKCVHCSVAEGAAHPHHQTTGFLDPALFEALVDDLVSVGARFDTLILFWLGEPLLHPWFPRIWRHGLRAAARHGTFGKVEVHSNGTHLSPELARSLVNQGDVPQVLHFSLDAVDRDTYKRVKGLDRFDKVQANVAGFIGELARRGARQPRPVFQFIVGSNNVADVPAYRAHWTQVCREAGVPVRAAAGHVPPGDDAVIFFRQLDCPTAELQAAENAVFRAAMQREGLELPGEAAKGETVEASNLSPCSGFWKSPVVGWEGDVTTCTRDNLLRNSVGSLREHRFSELWWGGAMARNRHKVAQGDYAGLDLCSTCFIPRSLNHADLAPGDVEAQAAHDQAVARRSNRQAS